MSELLIHNVRIIPVIPRGTVYRGRAIYIQDGIIVEIDDEQKLKRRHRSVEKLDGKNGILLPGFINAHTHIPEALIRGLCDDEPLEKWLFDYVWNYEKNLTSEKVYNGTFLGIIELIRNGVTSFIDQYFFADSIARAVEKTGLRALICPSVFDNCPEGKTIESQLKIAKNFVKNWKNKTSLIYTGLGPHAPYSVSKEHLEDVFSFCKIENIPVHIHLSETLKEIKESKDKFKTTPIEYILNLMGQGSEPEATCSRILAAHCVYPTDKEIKFMAKKNIHVLHCPESNLKLGSGIAPVPEYLENNINVALGTDGTASNNNLNMLECMRITSFVQRAIFLDSTIMKKEILLEMATYNGAKCLGLSSKLGSIEVGKFADLIIIDTNHVNMQPEHDILSNIIYSAEPSNVRTVIVNGKIIMHDWKIESFDEHKTLKKVYNDFKNVRSE